MKLLTLALLAVQIGGAQVSDQNAVKKPAYEIVDLGTGGSGHASLAGASGGIQAGRVQVPVQLSAIASRGGPTNQSFHASLWLGSAKSLVDINPEGCTNSFVEAVAKGVQVGHGNSGGLTRAILWHGAADSAVDLSSNYMVMSEAIGCTENVQVGFADVPIRQPNGVSQNLPHAFLWFGTAKSAIDLNPKGFTQSGANGAYGDLQLGTAMFGEGESAHVILWHGSAKKYVDLTPAGCFACEGKAISNTTQVGTIRGSGDLDRDHAYLWHGTADSAVDITPADFVEAIPTATTDDEQVGYGSGPRTHGDNHALLWHGTAESVVDLHGCLDKKFTSSAATGIDIENGDIVGYAVAKDGVHAIIWRKRSAAGK